MSPRKDKAKIYMEENLNMFLRHAKRNQEKALINEIDRILAETKTKIPLVRNYRKQLKEPISHALDEVSNMISQIPGPIELDPELWEKDPVLKAVFIGSDEFSQWLHSCRSLRDAFERTDAAELFGLLVAEYKEKTFFGYEMNGDILQRDVRLQSVFFEDPRILVPAPDLENARKELQHRILVMLFTHELDEISDLKSWKEELQKQKDLLEFELWGNEKPESEKAIPSGVDKADEAKKVLSDIDQKIEQIGKNLDTPEGHLAHVVRILTELRQHLRMDRFMIRLNSLGVKVKASSSESFSEISLAEFTFTGYPKRAAIWTRINKSSMLGMKSS